MFNTGWIFGNHAHPKGYTIQDMCLDCNRIYGNEKGYTTGFIDNINTINENCGSTFITKKYGSDNWYIFTTIHKDGWSKNEYVPVEDCLNKPTEESK
jgi:hypothetical protein